MTLFIQLYLLVGLVYLLVNVLIRKIQTEDDWMLPMVWLFFWWLCFIALFIAWIQNKLTKKQI